jgi:hypothetical protein
MGQMSTIGKRMEVRTGVFAGSAPAGGILDYHKKTPHSQFDCGEVLIAIEYQRSAS